MKNRDIAAADSGLRSAADAPRVSVVVPTFNRDTLLLRSLRSVLRQTEPRLEVIVVDDASTIDTRAVAESLGDSRVRFIRLEKNQGPSVARNRGVQESRTPLVAFHDSDDEWFPHKLSRQLACLDAAGDGVGVITCDKVRVWSSGNRTYHRTPDVQRGRLLSPETGFYQTFAVGAQTALMRRELLLEAGGFDPEMRWFEDSDLFLRLAAITEFRRVPEPLVLYYQTGGLTTDHGAEIEARRQMLEKYGAALRRESPTFVAREKLLLAAKSLLGRRAAGLRGRPYGPPPPEPELEVPSCDPLSAS